MSQKARILTVVFKILVFNLPLVLLALVGILWLKIKPTKQAMPIKDYLGTIESQVIKVAFKEHK